MKLGSPNAAQLWPPLGSPASSQATAGPGAHRRAAATRLGPNAGPCCPAGGLCGN